MTSVFVSTKGRCRRIVRRVKDTDDVSITETVVEGFDAPAKLLCYGFDHSTTLGPAIFEKPLRPLGCRSDSATARSSASCEKLRPGAGGDRAHAAIWCGRCNDGCGHGRRPHWIHIRTTNPVESTFATVRLRTKKTKGAGSRLACLTMVFKLAMAAQKQWRALNGSQLIADVIDGVPFVDGLRKEAA